MSFVTTANPQSDSSTIHADAALRIVKRLLHGFNGSAAHRLWNGRLHTLGAGVPTFSLVLRDPLLLRKLITARSPVILADAYFRGQLDLEGDLYSALALKTHFESISLPWRDKLSLLLDAWRLHLYVHLDSMPTTTMARRIARSFSRQQGLQDLVTVELRA